VDRYASATWRLGTGVGSPKAIVVFTSSKKNHATCIHAFLEARPAPPAVDTIPQLK